MLPQTGIDCYRKLTCSLDTNWHAGAALSLLFVMTSTKQCHIASTLTKHCHLDCYCWRTQLPRMLGIYSGCSAASGQREIDSSNPITIDENINDIVSGTDYSLKLTRVHINSTLISIPNITSGSQIRKDSQTEGRLLFREVDHSPIHRRDIVVPLKVEQCANISQRTFYGIHLKE